MNGGGCGLKELLKLVVLLAIPSLVVWSVLYPGYLQADHQIAIARFAQGSPIQQHSLLWTLIAFPLVYCMPSLSFYGLFQICFFVLCASICLVRLKAAGVIKRYFGLGCFFGFFPTYVLYNQLYASDTVFAYALMVVTALAIELAYTKGSSLNNRTYVILLTVFLVLASVLRKNSVLLYCVMFLLLLLFFKEKLRTIALAFCGGFSALVVVLVITPFALSVPPASSGEALSVPCLQVARVFADGGVIPADQMESLTRYRSADEWAASYLPYCADSAKAGMSFSWEFVRDWLVLGVNNPGSYVRTYLTLECPFWQFGMVGYGDARIAINQNGTEIDFGNWESFTKRNSEGLRESYVDQFGSEPTIHWFPSTVYSFINELHLPLLTSFTNLVLFNRALPLWSVLGLMIYLVSKKMMKRSWLIVAPVLVTVLSFLVFAPEALFRYSMQTYYALPFLFLWGYVVHSRTRQNPAGTEWSQAMDESIRDGEIGCKSILWSSISNGGSS